jgi:hypothetical protein
MIRKLIFISTMFLIASIIVLSVIDLSQRGSIVTPVSMPVSSNMNVDDRTMEFTLNRITVVSAVTGETINYTFSSFIDYPVIEGIDPDDSSTLFTTSQFNIYISTPAESFGGIIEAQEIKENILNQFNAEVVRVKDIKPGLTNTFFENFGYELYKERYFYGTKVGNQCLNMYEITFCDAPHILVNNDIPLVVYCAVVDSEAVKFCDEFVSNLKLIKSEVITKPVSYYR